MRIALTLALAMLVVPACKSHKSLKDEQQMRQEAPDAKPMLHVAQDDPRYVASSGGAARQIHYYSVKMDTTYVVDESTGTIVTTYKSKEMPGVVVIEKPAYQPPPLEAQMPAEGSSAPAKEGCGAEVEVVEETEAIEVEEGCKADDAEGCGDDEDDGCGDDDGDEDDGEGEDEDEGEDDDDKDDGK